MSLVLCALLAGGAAAVPAARGLPVEAAREQRFLELLRSYPERPPEESFRLVAALVDAGPFPQRDRAEFWIGSARLAAQDRAGARAWFARLAQDHPGSVWVERSWLGLGDADAQERRFGPALAWYRRAESAHDAAVVELARISGREAIILRSRQRLAWAGGGLSAGVALFFLVSALRRSRALSPLPAEARIVAPVLGVLALLSLRVDPAPRSAILLLCGGGFLLALLSGLRLRAVAPRGLGLWLHGLLAALALSGLAYVAVYDGGLIGMVQETFRTGPE